MFSLWYIVQLPIRVVNDYIMNEKICAILWLRNMRQLQLFRLCWHSFSGCGRKHVAVVFASKCYQYWINGCLQPIRTSITQDAKVKMVDAPLKPILRMRQRVCRCCVCKWRRPISDKWMTATNRKINYPGCTANNRCCSVDTHSQNGPVTVLLSFLPLKAANTSVMHNSDRITV